MPASRTAHGFLQTFLLLFCFWYTQRNTHLQGHSSVQQLALWRVAWQALQNPSLPALFPPHAAHVSFLAFGALPSSHTVHNTVTYLVPVAPVRPSVLHDSPNRPPSEKPVSKGRYPLSSRKMGYSSKTEMNRALLLRYRGVGLGCASSVKKS